MPFGNGAHLNALVDGSTRFSQTTRTLRLFLSHTVSGQLWQTGGDVGVPNFDTGEGIPAWAFKIEGRLLEVCFFDFLIIFRVSYARIQ